jgi:hypothetical protein
MEPLALWGAVVGTTGAALALRREYLANRRRLAVVPNVRLNISRQEPVGEVMGAFALIQFWNSGGRALAVERVGFRFLAEAPDGSLRKRRAEILLEAPIGAQVDGPSHTVYTPLGPMMSAGISPFGEVEAFAATTGGRSWSAPPQPLIHALPPLVTDEQLGEGLTRLREEADRPPVVGEQIALHQVLPVLPGEGAS